jgi:hypothetical protein
MWKILSFFEFSKKFQLTLDTHPAPQLYTPPLRDAAVDDLPTNLREFISKLAETPVVPEKGAGGISVGCVNRRLNASLLFDIVDERKRSAGGVCPGGSCG